MKRDFLITLNLPEWARWYAVDADGMVWCYENKPCLDLEECDHIWFSGGRMEEVGISFAEPLKFDWTKTLHEIEVSK